jgi:hypothetical protein
MSERVAKPLPVISLDVTVKSNLLTTLFHEVKTPSLSSMLKSVPCFLFLRKQTAK